MTTILKRQLLLFAFIPFASSHALEIAPADYEPIPAGMTALLTYFQHAERKELFQDGDKISNNARLSSDIAMLRVIHSVGLGDRLVAQPQFILPYGHLHAGGDFSPLGQASGTGDLILGSPFIWTLPNATNDILSLAPFIYLPTGSYDRDDPLNLGENRWRFLLQVVYTHHFSERWALDSAADVSWVTRNDDYSPGAAEFKQEERYEYQAHLRYNLTPHSTVAVGGGYIEGARSRIDGVRQDDELGTTYARLSLTHWLQPTFQVQAQLGRDLNVEQGFKEDLRINLRIAKLF